MSAAAPETPGLPGRRPGALQWLLAVLAVAPLVAAGVGLVRDRSEAASLREQAAALRAELDAMRALGEQLEAIDARKVALQRRIATVNLARQLQTPFLPDADWDAALARVPKALAPGPARMQTQPSRVAVRLPSTSLADVRKLVADLSGRVGVTDVTVTGAPGGQLELEVTATAPRRRP